MNNLLNKQLCIKCHHAEKWHNEDGFMGIMCMAYVTDWISDMTEGISPIGGSMMKCGCKDFKMDNLKYLEERNG